MSNEEFRAWARAERDRLARVFALSETDRDIIRLANDPGFSRWIEQIRATGGCAHPIHLTGSTVTRDATTGTVLASYSTDTEPGARLAVRCRNRRTSRCPSCSREHQGDTFQLVRAGLLGGKGVPAEVSSRPRVFATLTAPSFGAVHRATTDTPCSPGRRGTCEHGAPRGCGARHAADDRAIGQPLCPACYDYTAHVLWQAHAGPLWDTFTRTLRRRLATAAGIPRSKLRDIVTVSFAKVAEYQARGAVHVHAVIRLDGPDGPGSEPPAWATADLLGVLVPDAAAAVRVYPPETEQLGAPVLGWGRQLDVRPLRADLGDADGLTDDAVAAYLAKYVTKAAGDATGAPDTPIRTRAAIDRTPGTRHTRALMHTAWDLAAIPELAHLRLREWAHMLAFRGHALTKSRAYSTTYQALRTARRNWHTSTDARDHDVSGDTVTDSRWQYAGQGHSSGEAEIAAGIATDMARSRELAREHDALLRRGWAV